MSNVDDISITLTSESSVQEVFAMILQPGKVPEPKICLERIRDWGYWFGTT